MATLTMKLLNLKWYRAFVYCCGLVILMWISTALYGIFTWSGQPVKDFMLLTKLNITDSAQIMRILEEELLSGFHTIRDVNWQSIVKKLRMISTVQEVRLGIDETGYVWIWIKEKEPIARVIIRDRVFYLGKDGTLFECRGGYPLYLPVIVLDTIDSLTVAELSEVVPAIGDVLGEKYLPIVSYFTFNRETGKWRAVLRINNISVTIGRSENFKEALKNLRNWLLYAGKHNLWHRYSEINLEFKGMVVAKRKKNVQ